MKDPTRKVGVWGTRGLLSLCDELLAPVLEAIPGQGFGGATAWAKVMKWPPGSWTLNSRIP